MGAAQLYTQGLGLTGKPELFRFPTEPTFSLPTARPELSTHQPYNPEPQVSRPLPSENHNHPPQKSKLINKMGVGFHRCMSL